MAQNSNDGFPVVIEGGGSLPDYMTAQKTVLDERLVKNGAILFRGFGVVTASDFDAAVASYGEASFTYAESLSNAVRVNVTERVFTANEAPPQTSIFLHHEMAQTPIYPSKLFFFCEIAAEEGGATPICRSDILLEQLRAQHPALVAEFAAKGVRYTNVMPPTDDAGSGQGRSWRSTLNVDSRDAAETRLRSLDYEWQWQADDSLRATTPVLDAIRTLDDGREVFFNQLIAAFRGWQDARNNPSKAISFGDGTPIAADDMAVAITLSDALTYDLQWQAGDVVLLDNFLVMHGRRPFVGKRRVLASLIS